MSGPSHVGRRVAAAHTTRPRQRTAPKHVLARRSCNVLRSWMFDVVTVAGTMSATTRRIRFKEKAMQRYILASVCAVVLATPVRAQQPDSLRRDSLLDARALPREVAREVTELFNAAGTLRVTGSLEIVREREVRSDVAVIAGPVRIAGHVTGTVVAINADVMLERGARIDGDLLVVGGAVSGKGEADVGGDIRVYRQALRYHEDGERIVADRGAADDDRWWRRWHQRRRSRLGSNITLVTARTYNRVEGLPILVGPTLRLETGWGRLSADALGIVRTADNFSWNSDNLGHRLKSDLRVGGRAGLLVGGTLFDEVEPVESWHLTDTEVGLASFLLHRDYRDYYNRHGASMRAGVYAGEATLALSYSDERWAARDERSVFSLFRNSQAWRPNPDADDGRFHLANATLRYDTRNDEDDPWSGWYLVADYERGSGRVERLATTSPGVRESSPGPIVYSRAFLDLRRYLRISQSAQVNVRAVAGGWLNGDELPLQRRFSVGGPGTLPGFDFRRVTGGGDVFQCSAATTAAPRGRPAQCERVALAQVEYRGDLNVHLGILDGGDENEDEPRRRRRRRGFEADGVWVLFADAGRGWLVGSRDGDLSYPSDALPRFSTFRTDVGAGLDFGDIGLFMAKSVSDAKQPVNFFVRIKRRF